MHKVGRSDRIKFRTRNSFLAIKIDTHVSEASFD